MVHTVVMEEPGARVRLQTLHFLPASCVRSCFCNSRPVTNWSEHSEQPNSPSPLPASSWLDSLSVKTSVLLPSVALEPWPHFPLPCSKTRIASARAMQSRQLSGCCPSFPQNALTNCQRSSSTDWEEFGATTADDRLEVFSFVTGAWQPENKRH